jgi:hypothetical protein
MFLLLWFLINKTAIFSIWTMKFLWFNLISGRCPYIHIYIYIYIYIYICLRFLFDLTKKIKGIKIQINKLLKTILLIIYMFTTGIVFIFLNFLFTLEQAFYFILRSKKPLIFLFINIFMLVLFLYWKFYFALLIL